MVAAHEELTRTERDLIDDVFEAGDRAIRHVYVDGAQRYTWAISSGLAGGPPSGSYRPERLERKWYSRKYDWAPMPHAIFFHQGYAIHGTNVISRLGRRASHGCVRLHPQHAAILFDLVQGRKSSTRIIVSDSNMVARR